MVRLVAIATCVLGIAGCTFNTSATGVTRDGSGPPPADANKMVIDAGDFDASVNGQDGDVPVMTYIRTIEINPPVMTEELDGFVVAILIDDDSRLKSHARTDGADIVFKTTQGIPLLYEIESYDGNSGSLVAWVRLSSLPISGTSIVMHYGGAVVSHNAAATWNPQFTAVWHFSDDVVAQGVFPDSTGGGSNTAIAPSGSAPTSVVGIAGAGLLFDGTDDSLYVPNSAAGPLNFDTGSFSYSAWVFVATNVGEWDSPYHKGGSSQGGPGYSFELGMNDWAMAVSTPGEEKTVVLGDSANLVNKWVHLVGVVDGTANQASGYLNGAFRGETELLGSVSGANEVTMSRPSSDDSFKGRLDEVRIYNVALSEDWIAAEYTNLNDPVSFLDIGPEVSLGNGL